MRLATCVLLLVGPLLAAVIPRNANAQEIQSGYLLQGPNDGWYAVVTPMGRWKAQLADGCPIAPGTDVDVIDAADTPETIDRLEGGASCALANVSKVSDLPCLTAYGLCEVRLELVSG
jgi:hypothetical protein